MKFALVAALVMATASYTENFVYEGNTYQLVTMGKHYVVYPRAIVFKIQDESGLQPIDCDKLAQHFKLIDSIAKLCRERPTSSSCHLQKGDIEIQSHEEYFQKPPLLLPASRSWRLMPPTAFRNQSELRDFVANHFALNPELVETEPRIPIVPMTLVMNAQEDSLTAKVTQVVPIKPGVLEPFTLNGNSIRVDNRFLACDLERKKLKVSSTFSYEANFTKRVSPQKLADIWEFYGQVRTMMATSKFEPPPRFIEAALIAYELREVAKVTGITPEEMLRNLFVMDGWEITLKQFSNKEELENQMFPPVTHTKDIEISWSTE